MKKNEFVEFEGKAYRRTSTEICFHDFETGFTYTDDPTNPEELLKEGFVEVDKVILEPVLTLNKKGYKTSFSCGGHLMIADVEKCIDDIQSTLELYHPNYETYLKIDKYRIAPLFDIMTYVNIEDMYISFQGSNMKRDTEIFKAFNRCTRCNIHKEYSTIPDWSYDEEVCEQCDTTPREGIELLESMSLYGSFYDSCPYIMDGYFIHNDTRACRLLSEEYKETKDLSKILEYMKEKVKLIELEFDLWQQDMIIQIMKAVDLLPELK